MVDIQTDIKKGYIFNQTQSAIDSGKKVIVHKGGTGSGKTYELMIFVIFQLAGNLENKVFTIVSESQPHLDIGAIRYTNELLIESGMYDRVHITQRPAKYIFPTGSIVEFFGADRLGKAVGARRYLLYGNEINHIKFDIFDEMARRSKIVLADFNPTAQFWLEKFLQYYDDNIVIKSNHTNNKFLDETERKRIIKRALMDANFKRVHIDCEYGSTEGIIYDNWAIVDEFPKDEKIKRLVYGMDFGYSNDPTAIIKVGMSDGELYLDEILYRTGMTNQDTGNSIKSIITGHANIWADSADPKGIEEIRRMGFNIKGADKGKDSVVNGIDFVKRYKMNVTARSTNLIKELRNYTWQSNKDGGYINKPIDDFNHLLDALRYAVTMTWQKKGNRIISIS